MTAALRSGNREEGQHMAHDECTPHDMQQRGEQHGQGGSGRALKMGADLPLFTRAQCVLSVVAKRGHKKAQAGGYKGH